MSLRTDRYRLVIFVKRNPALSFEEFSKQWIEVHGPKVVNTEISKNIIRYEQLVVNQEWKAKCEAAGEQVPDLFDGLAIVEADSKDTIIATVTSDEWNNVVVSHGNTVIDQASAKYALFQYAPVISSGEKIKPSPKLQNGRLRLLINMSKKPEMSSEEFSKYWLEHPGKTIGGMAEAKKAFTKYEQWHLAEPSDPNRTLESDGISVFEGVTPEDMLAVFQSGDWVNNVVPYNDKFTDSAKRALFPVDVAVLIDRDA